MATRKVPVTVTYTHHAAQPPIFLAGSFSDPAWHPQEMEFKKDDAGEFYFYKEVFVEAGSEYQYKFRIGPGEWWVLDETAPTVTDALENRNNLLVTPVKEDQKEGSSPQKSTDRPTEPVGDVQIPALVVEKTDTEPSHGDDFGDNATVGQKEVREMRAQNAEPDITVVKAEDPFPVKKKDISTPEDAALTTGGKDSSPQSPDAELSILEERRLSHTPTPEVDATAAEVADSAAKIDCEENPEATADAKISPPPGLHEIFAALEARRLSHTPIGEVADTAAEVADSAAEIDREVVDNQEFAKALPRFNFPPETGTESGAATPANEQPPLFAHERFEPYDGEEKEICPSPAPSPSEHEYEQPDEEIDTNDPTLEEFPEDMSSILTHIRSTESRLGADQTEYDPTTGFPVKGLTELHKKELSDPNPDRFSSQPSLSLAKIDEGEEEQKVDGDSKSSDKKDIDDNTPAISISRTDGGEDIAEPLQPGENLKIVGDTRATVSQHSMDDCPSTIVTTLPSSAVDPPSLLQEVEAMPMLNDSILDHITIEAPGAESIPALQSLGAIISPEPSAPTSADQKDITGNTLTANDDTDINGHHSLEEYETMASQVSVKGGGDERTPSPGIEEAEAALISKGAMEASNDSSESPKSAEDVADQRQSTELIKPAEVQKETTGPSPVEDAPIKDELQLKSVEIEESPIDLQQETVGSTGQSKAVYGDEPSTTAENSQARDESQTEISVGQLHPAKDAEIHSTVEEPSQVEMRDTREGSLPIVEEVQALFGQKAPAKDAQTKSTTDESIQHTTGDTDVKPSITTEGTLSPLELKPPARDSQTKLAADEFNQSMDNDADAKPSGNDKEASSPNEQKPPAGDSQTNSATATSTPSQIEEVEDKSSTVENDAMSPAEQKPPARDDQTKTSADESRQIKSDTTESEAGPSAAADESQSKPVGIESTSPKLTNTGNATGLDGDITNGTSGLKKRNERSEHSSESGSLPSPTKESQHQSFITFIWQKVFVTWIGGFLKKLFSGERRQMIGVAGLVIVAIPVLYVLRLL